MKYMLLIVIVLLSIAGCRHVPPGHDPKGPGNSENAPGHNKNSDEHSDGSGNSGNAPGQKKKHSY